MRIVKSTVLYFSVSILFLGTNAFAQGNEFDPSRLSNKGRQAYQSLLTTDLFAIGGIGYGGETSKGELALDVLIEESEALPALRQLIASGTAEAAVYGLFGLRMLGCECYRGELTRLRSIHFSKDNSKGFTTQAGCIVFPAESYEDKNLIFNEIIAKLFAREPELKNCRRKAQGNREDLARCVRGLNK